MSRQALDRARRVKRPPRTTRIVICEEVFDYVIGDMYIAVAHSLTKTSFLVLRGDVDVTDRRALKKAIHARVIEIAPQIEAARKKNSGATKQHE